MTAEPDTAAGRWREAPPTGWPTAVQAALRHLEDADLRDRAEAVLHRSHDTERVVAIAFEVQHRVDHVLEHARTGDRSLLRDVTDDERRDAVVLRDTHEPRRARADLPDRARDARGVGVEHRLDRVDDQDVRRGLRARLPRRAATSVTGSSPMSLAHAEPTRAHLHLRRRLLAAHVQHTGALARQRVGHLQQQRRLADARLAAEQHERPVERALRRAPDRTRAMPVGSRRSAAVSTSPSRTARAGPDTREEAADWLDGLLDERSVLAALHAAARPTWARRARTAAQRHEVCARGIAFSLLAGGAAGRGSAIGAGTAGHHAALLDESRALALALGRSGYAGALAERHVPVLVDDELDDVAGLPLAGEDLLGQRVLDEALDRAPQRTGAERRVETLLAPAARAPRRVSADADALARAAGRGRRSTMRSTIGRSPRA